MVSKANLPPSLAVVDNGPWFGFLAWNLTVVPHSDWGGGEELGQLIEQHLEILFFVE